MGIYNGFDIGQMLNVLQRHAEKVNLYKCTDDVEDWDWVLYVCDERFGEYENKGRLFDIVMFAFKPYMEIAKQERAEFRSKFSQFGEKYAN